ncbi:MAG: tripartite tricarboxylate transporter TctB family protein, partial [Deltaproteobacteria bacterium]|nr:tripartite tricarboxylate transporter TctB family protein [Deltaproteobacteria bacterium]
MLVFCATIYFALIPTIPEGLQIEMSSGTISPRVFPRFVVLSMAVLAAAILASAIRGKGDIKVIKGAPEVSNDAPRFKPPAATGDGISHLNAVTALSILVIYVFLLELTGYLVSTPLALTGLLLYFGARNPIKIGVIAVATTVVLYLFFGKIMHVMLPEG